MRQAHLTIKLMEIAVRERCRLKIREQPIFNVRADRLDGVESQRRSAIEISMNHADAGVEALGEQRYRHLGEICRNLGDGVRTGGVVDRHLDDLDTVLESDSFDEFGQLVLTL